MQDAHKRFQKILHKYYNAGFTKKDLAKLDVNKSYGHRWLINKFHTVLLLLLISVLMIGWQVNFSGHSECLIDMPSDASKWFREPETCDFCSEVNKVDKQQNLSSSHFHDNYLVNAKPVVVTDGAKNWAATRIFSFDFFKKLYESNHDDRSNRQTCQFFPYKTKFGSLMESLQMDPRRANFSDGQKPWYIGWSNCNDRAGRILREYYEVPYFLPNTSENMALNWIFMGGPGNGAHMHVDNVQYPSWQAQLKGRKKWRLAPPPECYYRCQEMEVVVKPGDIIVLDTNRWYHQTFILPGEISITIGSEFD